MYTYDWYHWITFFYIYCFFGWIFESAYVSFKKRQFVNRGFLRLPMLPLYGTGAVMMLWVSLPVKDNLFLVYISGVIAATALEYVTGYMMEQLFKMKYWDYSNQKFQLHGYICLTSSIAWGFLTIFLTNVIHRPVANLVLSVSPAMESVFLVVVSGFFLADVVQSTKEALALGKVLEAMTSMKAELEEIQVQMALLKAETTQRMEDIRSDTHQRMTEAKHDIALRTAQLRSDAFIRASRLKEEAASLLNEQVPADAGSFLEERIRLLTERHRHLLEARQSLLSHMSLRRRGILKGNPSASSGKFGEALRELREIIKQR